MCLSLDEFLPLGLDLGELLILAVLLELIESVLLACVLLDLAFLLELLLPLPLLVRQEIRIGLLECLLDLLLDPLAFSLLLGLPRELLLDLPLNEVTLKFLLLQTLDVTHLKLVQLFTNGLDVLLLAIKLCYQLCLHFLVISFHLSTIEFFPFFFQSLFMV